MSCCDKCAKTGGNCGPGSQQSSGFDDCGQPSLGADVSEGTKARQAQYRSTLGPRGMAGVAPVGLGAGDQTVNVGGATPTWELALIGAAGVALGIFANQMYRRRHTKPARR